MKNPVQIDLGVLGDINHQIDRDHVLEDFRPTAVAIVLRRTGDLERWREILFVKSVKGDYWGFPQGGIKEGEHVITGLFRELEEEVGIPSILVTSCDFCLKSQLAIPGKGLRDGFALGKSFYYFSLHCAGMPQVKLNTAEVDDYRWLSREDAVTFILGLKKRHKEKSADMLRALHKALGG